MSNDMLLYGFFIGLSVAAPVGPVSLWCIRNGLEHGCLASLVCGAGAASAHAAYGAVAGCGLTAVVQFLISSNTPMRAVGGCFLCYLGVKALVSAVASTGGMPKPGRLATQYVRTILLALTNPMTIISFAAYFASVTAAGQGHDAGSTALLVTGVFCGSLGWWLVLTTVIAWLRGRVRAESLHWIKRVSGAVVLSYGLRILVQAIAASGLGA